MKGDKLDALVDPVDTSQRPRQKRYTLFLHTDDVKLIDWYYGSGERSKAMRRAIHKLAEAIRDRTGKKASDIEDPVHD